MSWGARFKNTSGVVNIDEEFKSYVYLEKYGPFAMTDWAAAGADADYATEVTVTCVGYPIIFFSVPYQSDRAVALAKVTPLGSNQWRVTLIADGSSLTEGGPTAMAVYLRVFGRLDLNYPNGSGEPWGTQLRNASGEPVFDTGLRMLRLAGNTYDTEVTLLAGYPGQEVSNQDPTNDMATYNTTVPMPFSMENKSICANTRAILYGGYMVYGHYTSYDPYAEVYQVRRHHFASCYSASGTTLTAKKCIVGYSDGELFVLNGGVVGGSVLLAEDVVTRIAVIDNSQFP